MKLSKGWISRILFFSILAIGCLFITYVGATTTADNNNQLALKTVILCMFGFFGISCTYIGIYDFFAGHRYVETYDIPIEDFSIADYDNGTVVIYKNYAWIVPIHHKATLLKDNIKATQYYNRKKEETGWTIHLPYLRKVA